MYAWDRDTSRHCVEKPSVRLHTVRAATQSSKGTKQTGNFTCSLALVCACTDSCLATLQHWIQSTLYTHGIRPLLPGLHLSDRTPNSEQAKHRSEAIASQQHSTLVAVHLSKNSHVSSDPCFQKPFHTSAPYQQLSNSATVSTISLQSRTT